jgi:hypothetical protein
MKAKRCIRVQIILLLNTQQIYDKKNDQKICTKIYREIRKKYKRVNQTLSLLTTRHIDAQVTPKQGGRINTRSILNYCLSK